MRTSKSSAYQDIRKALCCDIHTDSTKLLTVSLCRHLLQIVIVVTSNKTRMMPALRRRNTDNN
jgi:hypothetical protein